MIQLKGSCQILVVDARTEEVKQVIEQTNIVTNYCLTENVRFGTIQAFGVSSRISISTSTAKPEVRNANLPGIIATGYVPGGVQSPTWNASVDPPFGEVINRIDFTGEKRTFNSVGLIPNINASNKYDPPISRQAIAYLRLDTECTQGEYDYLDIRYRIQFIINTKLGLTKRALLDFGRYFFYSQVNSDWRIYYLYFSWCDAPKLPYIDLYAARQFNEIGNSISSQSNVGAFWNYNEHYPIYELYKHKYTKNFGLNDLVGRIINMTQQGLSFDADAVYSWDSVKSNSPLQTIFTHSSKATVPFIDPLNFASGNGKLFTSRQWTGKLPELYKFTIVNSGAVGVSTYKWSVRKHLGFNGNSYSDASVGVPFRNPFTPAAPGMHGWRDENLDVLRFSDTQIVQYDDTGVSLLDVFDGSYKHWDKDTSPQLPVTQCRQCATDGSKIYVGCRQTGLWIIDVPANTISHPLSQGCYGVDVGRNNVAYALVEGGLYRSSDWSTSLPFTYIGITDSRWNRVLFLKADPEHIEDRIAVVFGSTNSNAIVWWKASTNQATPGLVSNSIKSYPASLDVSDTGSFWAIRAGRLNFGFATSSSFPADLYYQRFTHSLFGVDDYYKVTFYDKYLILTDRIIDSNGTTINSYSRFPTDFISGAQNSRTFALHLSGGITLTNRDMRQLFTDNQYAWTHYGWDGSNWVKDSNGAKTTHSDAQPLLNGLSIRFENAENNPHFVSGDFYTQSVNYGFLKSNADTFYYSMAFYSKSAQFKVPLPENFTIPSSPPYELKIPQASDEGFVAIEFDSPELHDFYINGVKIVSLYMEGKIPPGMGEIQLFRNGRMVFNAANGGQVVSGYFCYIKD